MPDRVTLRLQELKSKVENFGKKRGMNLSETIRFIVEDYFKITQVLPQKVDENFHLSVIDEMKTIKSEVTEVKNMVLVIGHNDDELHEEFVKYFPKYFKTKE